jgi:ubiquitin conjugation factor E4 B
VSLDPLSKYPLLPKLVEEFQTEQLELCFSLENADRVLYHRITLPENASDEKPHIFDYLVSCWIKAQDAIAKIMEFSKQDPQILSLATQRKGIVESLKMLVINYSGLVLNAEMADLFPLPSKFHGLGAGYLAQKMLPPNLPDEVPIGFLHEFITRFANDGLDDILRGVMKSLSAFMRQQNITTQVQGAFRALSYIVSLKPLANLV